MNFRQEMCAAFHRKRQAALIVRSATQHLLDRHQEYGYQYPETSGLILLTVNFSTSRVQSSRGETVLPSLHNAYPRTLMAHFKIAYIHMLNALLGKSFNRPSRRPLQPLGYAFFDHPVAKSCQRGAKSVKKTQNHDHIHAVLCLHPDTLERFRHLIHSGFFARLPLALGTPFEHIDCRLITETPERAIRYAAKLLHYPCHHNLDDLHEVFPVSVAEAKSTGPSTSKTTRQAQRNQQWSSDEQPTLGSIVPRT